MKQDAISKKEALMAEVISRKQFFREILLQAARVSVELMPELIPATKNQPSPMRYSFETDCTPELLDEEAKKMGLNPHNREVVLAAIAKKLKSPKS